jgi:hypothetical protein
MSGYGNRRVRLSAHQQAVNSAEQKAWSDARHKADAKLAIMDRMLTGEITREECMRLMEEV